MIITALHSIVPSPMFTHFIARNTSQAHMVTVTHTDALLLAEALTQGEPTRVPALQGGDLQLHIEKAGSGNRFDEYEFQWKIGGQIHRLFAVEDYGDHRTLLASALREDQSGEGALQISAWGQEVLIKAGNETFRIQATEQALLDALRRPETLPDHGPLQVVNVIQDEDMGGWSCLVVSAAYKTHSASGRLLISLPELKRATVLNQDRYLYCDQVVLS